MVEAVLVLRYGWIQRSWQIYKKIRIRTKFDLEHCEGDLCCSRSESEGRKS